MNTYAAAAQLESTQNWLEKRWQELDAANWFPSDSTQRTLKVTSSALATLRSLAQDVLSDGGRWGSPEAAFAQWVELAQSTADALATALGLAESYTVTGIVEKSAEQLYDTGAKAADRLLKFGEKAADIADKALSPWWAVAFGLAAWAWGKRR